MALQRCHYRTGHGLRIGARHLREHHHAREFDGRKRGDAQQQIGPESGQHQPDGEQRGADGATNQRRKDIHEASIPEGCRA